MHVFGIALSPSIIVLAIGVVILGVLTWKAQTSSKPFDIRDLVMQDGKMSVIQTTFVSSFLMTSWVVVDMEMHHTLTDTIFGAYLLAWVGPLCAKVIFNKTDVNFPTNLTGK